MAADTSSDPPSYLIPAHFLSAPDIPSHSHPSTKTSEEQDETVAQALPYLRLETLDMPGPFNKYGIQRLGRDAHIAQCYDMLEDFPAGFVVMDASRPWMIYWGLCSLFLLGEDITKLRRRVVATLAAVQNPKGGFAGGHGQTSHAAPSYASLMCLALVGGDDAYDMIDRTALWHWAASLKQRDGGFSMAVGGEEDVRGAYCIMSCIALLNLPLELPENCKARQEYGYEKFTDGLAEYISRCQTFEGGISGSPGLEAHGAYAFCGLASLSILGQPHHIFPKYLDMPSLIDWLSSNQLAPEGGFAGRTNKLVDGCYSHWAGGCWPLIEAAINGGKKEGPASPGLFRRQGLARWILNCCQVLPQGLLRDKPMKAPDAYHTVYNLAGLSGMQYKAYYPQIEPHEMTGLVSSFTWRFEEVKREEMNEEEDDGETEVVWEEEDRVRPIHPVFTIGHEHARAMRAYFEKKPLSV